MSMGIAGMNPLYLVLGLAVLGLAPFLLMLVTPPGRRAATSATSPMARSGRW